MKKVLCTENNKIYNSAKEAANELNLDVVKLRECARGQINSYKGFHFKYLK